MDGYIQRVMPVVSEVAVTRFEFLMPNERLLMQCNARGSRNRAICVSGGVAGDVYEDPVTVVAVVNVRRKVVSVV